MQLFSTPTQTHLGPAIVLGLWECSRSNSRSDTGRGKSLVFSIPRAWEVAGQHEDENVCLGERGGISVG